VLLVRQNARDRRHMREREVGQFIALRNLEAFLGSPAPLSFWIILSGADISESNFRFFFAGSTDRFQGSQAHEEAGKTAAF
jgi:hypothetical protein